MVFILGLSSGDTSHKGEPLWRCLYSPIWRQKSTVVPMLCKTEFSFIFKAWKTPLWYKSESESQASLLQGTPFYLFCFCKIRRNANLATNECSGRCKTNIFTAERSNTSRKRLSPVSQKEEVCIQYLQLEFSYNFTLIFPQNTTTPTLHPLCPCRCVCFRTIKVKKGTWLAVCSIKAWHRGTKMQILPECTSTHTPHTGHTNQHKAQWCSVHVWLWLHTESWPEY